MKLYRLGLKVISHEHKFIFIHINHCCGTSIESALKNFGEMRPANVDPISRRDLFDDQLPLKATQHMTALELKTYYGQEIWDSYFKFAFIANPFDRMVTAFLQRGKPIFAHNTLSEFFDGPYCNVSDPIEKERYPDRAYVASRVERMVSSSYSWLSDNNGEMLEIDFIGRKEYLNRDFEVVLDRLGIRTKLQHKNKTKNKKHYSKYYNEKTIRWVEERMSEDLTHFKYSFEEDLT
jgi:hypothetical protein